jgi:MtN3 and saliva related transmembrane protein
MIPSYIGALAGLLSTIALVPQVIKTHRSKHTRDLSLGMVAISGSGALLWIVYGAMIADPVILTTNICVGAMFGYLVLMKIKHG